jgi:cytidylate kinase
LLYYTLDLSSELIAIDGPVAVGKSSVGSLLARKLSFSFFDTGLMYRTFTWKVLKLGIPPEDENKLSHLANMTRFDFVPCEQGCLSVLIDDEDVSSRLARSRIEEKVSLISKVAGVREKMVSEQRRVAQRGKLIMAGRDIGTVVLPWAELKIFLVASVEERANRRYKELLERGRKVDYHTVLAELRQRDATDIHRAISPLKPAADAIIIDTENLSLEQVVDKIYDLAV